jgi:hypothetical protein
MGHVTNIELVPGRGKVVKLSPLSENVALPGQFWSSHSGSATSPMMNIVIDGDTVKVTIYRESWSVDACRRPGYIRLCPVI